MFKFGKKVNNKLLSLITLLPKNGEVLDLGSGLGANNIFLAKQGFKIACLDKDKEVIKRLKKAYPNINAVEKDILKFNFQEKKYNLVLALNVLHFFNSKDIKLIINNILRSLKKDGLFYLQVFSTKDSGYNKFLKSAKETEKNTFYSEKMRSFMHFFRKEELIKFFSKNRILEIEEKILKDSHPPRGKHKHAIIRILVRK
ncbi:MAG: hypothetical protein A3A94_00100 [Candidatus Portnoybacteria bacterium RIFCSPLOWO2_01_FULL_43_11]|uniref:Methyltransferase domain-containing protein n=3 Tax=Bacteria candidate phyla TaxID=1783234 RepID=A0A1G2FNI4_9BACT|nr:MAG: hypothetical protein A2713_00725 [candidate division WWE3 bacterium RIFCSPHIGHO2_01_FULL_35_17]OGZ38302.1 MAG: hypothetical protein A3A94_00100 [Candidatus Portnoybacteria bacterium RIFCSPLOWO2_01_FULL_43_11]OGZ39081.1 MAG: hypothetical protein A3E90_00775 [Candidatus Portnoybacteria bacterium RIFCSPHIGHO2_12_FULL_40_11]